MKNETEYAPLVIDEMTKGDGMNYTIHTLVYCERCKRLMTCEDDGITYHCMPECGNVAKVKAHSDLERERDEARAEVINIRKAFMDSSSDEEIRLRAERDKAHAALKEITKLYDAKVLECHSLYDQLHEQDERDNYKDAIEAELNGIMAMRQLYGAQEGETFPSFFKRIVDERDKAQAECERWKHAVIAIDKSKYVDLNEMNWEKGAAEKSLTIFEAMRNGDLDALEKALGIK